MTPEASSSARGSLSGEKGQEGQTGRVRGKCGRGGGRLVIPVGAGRIPDPAQQVPAVGERTAKDGALSVEPVGPESLWNDPILIRRSRQDHAHGGGGADRERDAGGTRRTAADIGAGAIAERGGPASIWKRRPAVGKFRPQDPRADRRSTRGERQSAPIPETSSISASQSIACTSRSPVPRPCRWWRRPPHPGRGGRGRTRQREPAGCAAKCVRIGAPQPAQLGRPVR